jgi:hypothetical protein
VDSNGGELLRYSNTAGIWSAPSITPVSGLQDVALQTDGQALLAVTNTAITPFNATTLVAGTPQSPALASGVTFKSVAIANDSQALLTTTAGPTTTSPLYIFNPRTQAFVTSSLNANNGYAFAPANGTQVLVVQQDSTGATTPALYQWLSSSGQLSTLALGINRNAVLPTMDRTGSRLVLNGLTVYDSSFLIVGSLPATTLAAVPSPDGTKIYAYDSAAAGIVTYDGATPAATLGTVLNVLGSTLPLSGNPGSNVQMIVSPFGNALFLAGSDRIVVVPVTP